MEDPKSATKAPKSATKAPKSATKDPKSHMKAPKSAMKLLRYSSQAKAAQLAQKCLTDSWLWAFQQLKVIFSTVRTNLCIWLHTPCLETYDVSVEQH